MFLDFRLAGLTTVLIGLSLYAWRVGSMISDLSAIFLAPLAALLFVAHRKLLLDVHQARRRIVWHEQAWPMLWFSGQLVSNFWALVFVSFAMPMLAWQAIVLSPLSFLQLMVTVFISSWLFTWLQVAFGKQLKAPFDRSVAINIATWAVAFPFSAIVAWQFFYSAPIPAELLNATIASLPRVALQNLPIRNGWTSEIIAPLHIYDSAKLWLAGQFPQQRWLAVVVSLDTALFGFIVARTSAIFTDLLKTHKIAVKNETQT